MIDQDSFLAAALIWYGACNLVVRQVCHVREEGSTWGLHVQTACCADGAGTDVQKPLRTTGRIRKRAPEGARAGRNLRRKDVEGDGNAACNIQHAPLYILGWIPDLVTSRT